MQSLADLPIGAPLGDQVENLALLIGESGQSLIVTP